MIISWERIQVEFLGWKFCRHPTGIQTLLPLTHVYTPLVTWGLYLDSCTLRQLLTTKASLRTTLRIQAKWLDTQQTYCLPVVIEVVLLGDVRWTTVLATSEPLWPGPNRIQGWRWALDWISWASPHRTRLPLTLPSLGVSPGKSAIAAYLYDLLLPTNYQQLKPRNFGHLVSTFLYCLRRSQSALYFKGRLRFSFLSIWYSPQLCFWWSLSISKRYLFALARVIGRRATSYPRISSAASKSIRIALA